MFWSSSLKNPYHSGSVLTLVDLLGACSIGGSTTESATSVAVGSISLCASIYGSWTSLSSISLPLLSVMRNSFSKKVAYFETNTFCSEGL